MEKGKCVLCGAVVDTAMENVTGATMFKCKTCGRYMFSEEMMDETGTLIKEEDKPALSRYTKAYEREEGKPLIFTTPKYNAILGRAKAEYQRTEHPIS